MPSYSTPLMVRQALAPGRWDQQAEPAPDEPTNTAADLATEQIQDAIAEADSLIDSYIAGRYLVPVRAADGGTEIPHPIDFWSRALAAYNATCTYRGSLDFTDQDPVYRRYAQVMLALTAVRDGKQSLPLLVESTGSPAAQGAGSPANPYTGNLFGQDDFNLAPVGASWPRPFPWGPPADYWPW